MTWTTRGSGYGQRKRPLVEVFVRRAHYDRDHSRVAIGFEDAAARTGDPLAGVLVPQPSFYGQH